MVIFRDSNMSDDGPVEYIVTGGLDDLVKVWELQDDTLHLKSKLEGHSLGVVSVAISHGGNCNNIYLLDYFSFNKLGFSVCFKLLRFKYENMGP